MRIFGVIAITLGFMLGGFWMVKFWGRSQLFIEYHHPMLTNVETPVLFYKPKAQDVEAALKSDQNLFLDVANTLDQKMVIITSPDHLQGKQIRNEKYDNIKDYVLLLSNYAPNLKKKKIIFNLFENAIAGHEIFINFLNEVDLQKGENFIVTSPFEAIAKSIKEKSPALLFGTTQPEILKIVAMDSMFLIEAANIRADFIIHPLKIRNQNFFNQSILAEIHRRHKNIIIGPETENHLEEANRLKPYGIILQK